MIQEIKAACCVGMKMAGMRRQKEIHVHAPLSHQQLKIETTKLTKFKVTSLFIIATESRGGGSISGSSTPAIVAAARNMQGCCRPCLHNFKKKQQTATPTTHNNQQRQKALYIMARVGTSHFS